MKPDWNRIGFLVVTMSVAFLLILGAPARPQDTGIQANRINQWSKTQLFAGVGQIGPAANTTSTPAAGFAGTAASAASSVTITFPSAFTQTPVCVATDQTTANTTKAAPTTTNVVITNSGAADTDVIAWACFGNPN